MKTKEELAREYSINASQYSVDDPIRVENNAYQDFLKGYEAAESRIEELERRLKATEQALMDRDMEVAKLKSLCKELEKKLEISVGELQSIANYCPIIEREFNPIEQDDFEKFELYTRSTKRRRDIAREALAEIRGENETNRTKL